MPTQETPDERGEETGDDELQTQEEELAELVRRMLASGVTATAIKKTMDRESREEKAKTKAQNLGRGRAAAPGKKK